MKPRFYIVLLLLCTINSVFGKENLNNLNFFEADIEAAKAKAKAEHKGVFVLYYADWCGFCQKLFNETLPDEAVQKALKAGFACYKIQNSTDEGNSFRTKYDIRSLPTLLFFDADGKLVLKQPGMQTKAKLFALVNKVYEEYYQKETPREFSFTPSLAASKVLKSINHEEKQLNQNVEAHEQTLIGVAPTVSCTGTGSCNDGNACTTGDVCVNNVCTGTAIVCNDNKPCTDDACNVATGCVFTNDNTNTCSDNSVCTSNDACSAGTCVGVPITCPEDNNVCTTAACNAVSGCYFANNSSTCNDNNPCTLNDACSAGLCNGTPKNCSDSNICTNDICNTSTGACENTNNSASCNDGNACTVNDVCAGGICTSGTPFNCNDNNACTDDACNSATGCFFVNDDSNTCNDGNPNTTNDRCSNGICIGDTPSFAEITPYGITIPKLSNFPTCDATKKGYMFYHTGQNMIFACNGTEWLQLNNSTSVAFEAGLANTTQSIPANNTNTFINFGSPTRNIGNDFSFITDTFTAEKEGFYHFDATANLGTGAANIAFTIEIVDGNGTPICNQSTSTSNASQMASCSATVSLAAGDTIKVQVRQNGTSPISITQGSTKFSGFRVY